MAGVGGSGGPIPTVSTAHPPAHLQVPTGIEEVAQLVVPHADALLHQVALGHAQVCRHEAEAECRA